MRKLWIPLALVLIAGCDKPEEMPPAQISPQPAAVEDKPTPPAPVEAIAEEGEGKGVGAAGCDTPECEKACEGLDQPQCAEAYAAGCFGDEPPDDQRCANFVRAFDAIEATPKAKSKGGAKPDGEGDPAAKATPIGD